VHLWHEQPFGVACPPFVSSKAAIGCFAATTCCLGIRAEQGRWRLYALHGLSDVFNLVVRPNPVLAPRAVYEAKTALVARAMAIAYRPALARRPPRRLLTRCVADQWVVQHHGCMLIVVNG